MVNIGGMNITLGLDLSKFEKQMKGIRRRFGRLSGQLRMAGGDLTRALTVPLAGIGILATKAAIDWETSFANVRKTVKGTAEELKNLETGLREMSQKLPMSAAGLASIAEEAGRLGISRAGLLDFTEVIVRLAETSTLGAEEAATGLARFAAITKLPEQNIENLATSLTVLGSEFATAEPEIMELGLRLAATGKLVGFSEAQILGLSAAMTAVGINAEKGGTAMSKVLIGIAEAASEGGKKLETMAQVAGVSADKFKQKFETDAAGAVKILVQGLGKLDKTRAFKAIDALGFSADRTRSTLLTLAGTGDLLNRTLATSSRAWEENTALVELSEKRFKTTGARLTILKNRFMEMARNLGTALAPALESLMEMIQTSFLPMIQGWIASFAALTPSGKALIVTLVGLAAAIGPLILMAGLLSGALAGVASMMTLIAANPVTALILGISALVFGAAAYNKVAQKMKNLTSGLGAEMTEAEQRISKLAEGYRILTRVKEAELKVARAEENLLKKQQEGPGPAGLLQGFEDAVKRAKKALEDAKLPAEGLTKAIIDQEIAIEKTNGALDEWEKRIEHVRIAKGGAGQEMELYHGLLAEETALQEKLARITGGGAADALDASRERYQQLKAILADVAAQMGANIDVVQKFKDAQEEAATSTLDVWKEWKAEMVMIFDGTTTMFDELSFDVMKRFSDGVGSAFASTLVEGKSFAQSLQALWKDIAKAIISRLVSIGIQMLIFQKMQKLAGLGTLQGTVSSKAGETYAGAFASVIAAVPFPLNVAMAPKVASANAAIMTAAALGIGMFAQGGIVTAPQIGLVGEAGPEAIIPLDRLGQFGGGGQVINLHVDGELLTQEVVKGMPAFIDARLGGI
jgi:TP901 family phage tail tape measure protein